VWIGQIWGEARETPIQLIPQLNPRLQALCSIGVLWQARNDGMRFQIGLLAHRRQSKTLLAAVDYRLS
jgi:hypothetical protein